MPSTKDVRTAAGLRPMLATVTPAMLTTKVRAPVTAVNGVPVYWMTEPDHVRSMEAAAESAGVVAFDVETTGLSPRRDRLALLQFATPSAVFFARPDMLPLVTPFLTATEGPVIVGQNLKFDLGFLAANGVWLPHGRRLFDTMLAAMVLHNTANKDEDDDRSTSSSLVDLSLRYLGVTLDKSEQTSDWGAAVLTTSQLQYAAKDVLVCLPLYDILKAALIRDDLARTASLEFRALPAFMWLEHNGAPLDVEAWKGLAALATEEKAKVETEMNAMVGAMVMPGRKSATIKSGEREPGVRRINWASNNQIKAVMATRGWGHLTKFDSKALTEYLADDPLFPLLLDYREAAKRTSSYGTKMLTFVENERLYPTYWQLGTISGRPSCSKPNLQQVPNKRPYRAAFKARPGHVLVKADYSQIEFRVMAQQAPDMVLRRLYAEDTDVHTATAEAVFGRTIDKDSTERKLGKVLNLALQFGMGIKLFRAVAAKRPNNIRLTLAEAKDLRWRWKATYYGIRSLHDNVDDGPVSTRTFIGRRCTLVRSYTKKLAMPVQGTAADGQKAAMALLYERRDRVPGGRLVLSVYDENVLEVPKEYAAVAATHLEDCMVTAMQPMLPDVPVKVEVTIGETWAG